MKSKDSRKGCRDGRRVPREGPEGDPEGGPERITDTALLLPQPDHAKFLCQCQFLQGPVTAKASLVLVCRHLQYYFIFRKNSYSLLPCM